MDHVTTEHGGSRSMTKSRTFGPPEMVTVMPAKREANLSLPNAYHRGRENTSMSRFFLLT